MTDYQQPDEREHVPNSTLPSGPLPVRSSEIVVPPGCACVSHDAIDCARIRDDLDTDDPRWDRRKCECECHARADDDDEE
jgi:hypothetical protein